VNVAQRTLYYSSPRLPARAHAESGRPSSLSPFQANLCDLPAASLNLGIGRKSLKTARMS
jgi:hypothetical protein